MTSTMANYILNLLRSVGTPESVVQNFAGAGIHHPKDLANLKVSDFPALGVTDPVQQKKILYLVQLVSTKTTMSDEHAETQSPSKRKSKSNLSLPSKSSSSKMDMVAAGNFDDVGADEKKTEDYLTSAGTSPGLDYKHSKSTPDKNSRRSRHQAKLESTALAGSVDDDNIKSPEQPAAGAAAPDSEPRRSDRIKAKNGGSKTKKKEDKKARTIFSSFEKVATVRVVPNSLITSVKKETSTGKWDASAESTLENTRNWSHNEDETATGPTITGALEHPSLTESVVKKKIDNSTVSKTRETSIAENTVTSPDTSKNSDPKSNLASRRSMMISKIPQSNLTGSNRFENSVSPYPNSNLRSTVLSLPSSNPNYNENRYKARISPDDHTKDSKTGSMQVNRNAQCETRSVDDDSLGRTSQSGKTNKLSLPAFDTNDFIPVGGNMNGDVDNGDSKIMSQLRRPKNRARSMYTGLPTLQQDGQSKQLRPPRSKRTSLSTLSRIDDLGLVNSSGLSSVLETPLLSLPTADESSYALMIDDLREENNKDHNDFHEKRRSDDELHYLDMRIRVVVRKRPMSKTERLKGGIDIIHPLDCGDYGKIIVYNPKTSVDLTKGIDQIKFVFDDVFDESSTNLQIYNRSVRHLIQNFFDGQFVTCFAYGATGSGKTFTMMGSEVTGINAGNSVYNESNVGLYYLAVRDIFSKLQTPEFSGCRLQVSLFEIYGGKLFDLLSTERRKEVKCLEDSKGAMCIKGLGAFSVESPEDVLKFIKLGSANRSTGETSANADSSRSHAVLQISLVEFTSTRKKETEKGEWTAFSSHCLFVRKQEYKHTTHHGLRSHFLLMQQVGLPSLIWQALNEVQILHRLVVPRDKKGQISIRHYSL